MKSIGIFIGRMNPPHLGHLKTINESIKSNDLTIIFLGSSNIKDTKNPYSFKNREEMLILEYKKEISKGKLKIEALDDISSDKEWTTVLGKKVKKIAGNFIFKTTIYGGDLKNDYAIQVIKKYHQELDLGEIFFKEISRNILKINHEGEEILFSSTRIRNEINKGNEKLIKKMVSDNYYNKV